MTIRRASQSLILLSALLCRQALFAATGTAGTINTYAGSDALFADAGRPAAAAHLVNPDNMVFDAHASFAAVPVTVTWNGVTSAHENVTIASTASPSFFLSEFVNGTAWVTGAVADGPTPSTECAVKAGSIHQLWVNGLVPKTSPLQDGVPAPEAALQVPGGPSRCQLTIGGRPAGYDLTSMTIADPRTGSQVNDIVLSALQVDEGTPLASLALFGVALAGLGLMIPEDKRRKPNCNARYRVAVWFQEVKRTFLFRRILSAGSLLGLSSLVGLLGPSPALAADYYVSPSGSDSSPGTLSQPFLTIQKAASVMAAGDTAFIRAGVFRETVPPANSGTQYAPITYMPYNGESVTVSGADVIPASSWTLSNGNIYKAPMSWDLGDGANQVFLDGRMMIEAQWPNTTLDISHPTVAHTSGGSYVNGGAGLWTGTISDVNLPARPAGYWNGATLNICLGGCWIWQTGTVTDSSVPQQVTFTFSDQGVEPSANNAYFLTGKLTELDAPGEWFRDSGTANLFFRTPLGDNPSQHSVEAKHRPVAFNLNGLSYITVQGIALFAATISSNPQSQYLVLDGLECQYIGHVALPLDQGSYYAGAAAGVLLSGMNNVLRNSTVAFSSGSGVFLQGTGQRVFNNVIRDSNWPHTRLWRENRMCFPACATSSPRRARQGRSREVTAVGECG